MINPLYGVNCLKLGFERYIRYSKINASIRCSRTSVSFYVDKGNGEKSMNARASNHHPNLQNYTKGGREPWFNENISVEFIVPNSFEDNKRVRQRIGQNANKTIRPFDVTINQYNSDLIEPTDIIEIFKAIIKFLNGNGYTDPFARSLKKAKIISRTANIKSNKSSAKEIREMRNNNSPICNESKLNEIAYLCLGDIIEKENNNIKESKYMKKNRIRLSESQLNRVIKESVKQMLNEEYPEIDNLKKQSRTYRYHDSNPSIMQKTFNRGMGALDFIQMIPDEKVLLVNKALAKQRDIDRIKQCFPEWTIEYVSLGYPDYYFKSLKGVRNK